MNMKKIVGTLLMCLMLVLLSCKKDNEFIPKNYSWEVSSEIPPFREIDKFRIGDSNTLLMSGVVDQDTGVFKLNRGKWEIVEKTHFRVGDFIFYRDVLYVTNGLGLFRVGNSVVEKLSDARFMNLVVYNNRLIVSGYDPIEINNNPYGTVSFDGTSFTPVWIYGAFTFLIVNNKLFIIDAVSVEYDGQEVKPIKDLSGESAAQDLNGNVYVVANPRYNKCVVRQYNQSKILGDTLMGNFLKIATYNKTIVVTGNKDPHTAASYFYTVGSWKEISSVEGDSTITFGAMVTYNNKLLAVASSGLTVELKGY
jgi:hypothetical protein